MFSYVVTLMLMAQAISPSPAVPAPKVSGVEAENGPRIRTAAQLLKDHQPQTALDVLTVALAAYDADHATEKRRLYCGMSIQEGILYAGMAARDKVGAVILPPGYCTALYLKGYALIDLGRLAEAKATYEKVIALAPMYAHYLVEYGQLARIEKDWPTMLARCTRAGEAAVIASPDIKAAQQGAALRCQGFALVEEHKLDEAEGRYNEALKIDPADQKSQDELRYIIQQRAKH